MMKVKGVLFAFAFVLINTLARAQTSVATKADTVDVMRSNGKIYVVMAVILIIMTGFFSYLITVDRKISRLEKEVGK